MKKHVQHSKGGHNPSLDLKSLQTRQLPNLPREPTNPYVLQNDAKCGIPTPAAATCKAPLTFLPNEPTGMNGAIFLADQGVQLRQSMRNLADGAREPGRDLTNTMETTRYLDDVDNYKKGNHCGDRQRCRRFAAGNLASRAQRSSEESNSAIAAGCRPRSRGHLRRLPEVLRES